MENLHDRAVSLFDLGLCIFPLKPHDKRPASERWKQFQETKPSADQIEKWWSGKWVNNNIAVVCGPISNVFVVDVDGDDGAETLANLQREHGGLPTTWRSSTGKGEHIWFKYPAVDGLGNSCGSRLGHGIDTRGAGGYVVGPGSIHPNGSEYAWQDDYSPADVPLAEMPGWLLDLLTKAPERPQKPSNGHAPASEPHYKYCRAALDSQRAELSHEAGGSRNEALNISALKLGSLLHYDAYTRDEAE